MKRLFLLLIIAFIGFYVNAQNLGNPSVSQRNYNPTIENANAEWIVASKPEIIQRSPKAILGEITGLFDRYVSGTTFELTFSFNYMSYDYEYVKGISIVFPEGVSVNSAQASISGLGDPLNYNGATGDAATVIWGDVSGEVGGGAYLAINNYWTVNMTVDPSFSGDLIMDWTIMGAGKKNAEGEVTLEPTVKVGTVKLTQEAGTDIQLVQVLPLSVLAGETIYPEISVSYATATIIDDFNITFTANNGTADVYTSVKNVAGANYLGFGEDVYIMDDGWTVAEGEYAVTVSISQADDNMDNNEMELTFRSGYYQEMYAGNSAGRTYNVIDIATGALTQVGSMASSPLPSDDELIGDVIYRICTNGTFGTVTPFGDFTRIGQITLPGWNQSTGMAYDWVNDEIYILMATTTTSGIYKLKLDNLTITQVGQDISVGNMFAMDMGNDGMLYCVNTTNLYKVDPATAEATDIGAHGLYLLYMQDAAIEPYTNTLYTITSEEGSRFRFGYYNLHTAAFTEIALMDPQQQYSTLVCANPPIGPLVITTNPVHQAVDLAPESHITVTFNVDLTAVDLTGITIVDEDNVAVANVEASVTDKTLNIAHANFDFKTSYTVTVPAGSVSDGTIANQKDIVWTFKIGLDPTACNEPSELYASQTSYDAVLSWKENGAGINWDIKWGVKGFDVETEGTLIEATPNDRYTLENLTPATEYDFYVRANCGGGEHSIWSEVYSFRTYPDCNIGFPVAIDNPWKDGFEDEYLDCWNVFDPDGDGFSWALDTDVHSGDWSVSHYYAFSQQEGWLVTPKISIPEDEGNYLLTFWNRTSETSYYEYNGVWISTGDADPAMGDYVEVWKAGSVSAAWVEILLPVNEYAGKDIYIAFVYEGYAAHNWFIDDVSVGHFDKIDAEVLSIVNPSNSAELTDSEQVTVSIKNNGSAPISNFDIMLELNGEVIATETCETSISSLGQGNYTFDATVDMSEENILYAIKATVKLEGDQDPSNDAFTKMVRHIGSPVKLFGYRIFEGQTYDFDYSVITFMSNAPGTVITASKFMDGNNVPSGGEYVDGKLYMYTRRQLSPYEAQNYVVLDTKTWTAISTTSITKEGYDMAYDYTSETMYTIHRDPALEHSDLYTVNLEDGGLTLVGSMGRHFWTLACNLKGEMYGVDTNGVFCSVDKATGAIIEIGATGIRPSYVQSMAFDHNSGRLFWGMTNTGEQGRLMEIDLATGIASNLGTLGDNIEVVALYSEYPAVPDLTLSSLTVTPGKLTPDFTPYVYDYTVEVAYDIDEVSIAAKAFSPDANITGTGPKSLGVGDNVFRIIVSLDQETDNTYEVTVKRLFGDGIDSMSADQLQVYPNPTHDFVYIKGAPAVSGISVYDLQGILLIKTQGDKVDLSSLADGMYVIEVDGVKVKVIKD